MRAQKKKVMKLEDSDFMPSSPAPSEDNKVGDDEEVDGVDGVPEAFTSNQGEEAEEVPDQKKRKKRSQIVSHDHINILKGDPVMYQCTLCQKKFKTKAHIQYHEFCRKGNKPFKCEQCGQEFIAKSHYEYHLRTHTGEKPYKCPKCRKGFNQRGKVTRHMRSHTGEKPFICQECNTGFVSRQGLQSHILIHTGERPFACTYCSKRFTRMTNLKKHVISHTGERPFTCTHCRKSFGVKWTLNIHLRTHSGERPYKCDQCSRAFSNSKDLRRHLIIHTGESPFICWICGTSFRRKDNLDRHIHKSHKETKEVARKLANEAAAEYLRNNYANGQTLQYNRPFRKINSVVIANIIKKNDLFRSQAKPNSTVLPKKDPQPSTSGGVDTGRAEVTTKPEVFKKGSSSTTKGNASSKRNSRGKSESSPTKKEIVSTAAAPVQSVPESPKKKGKKSNLKMSVTRSPSPNIRVDSVVSLATGKENSPETEVEIIEEEKETTSTSVLNEDRTPTLTLVVTITSPKRVEKEKEEEVKFVTPTQEQDDDENVECILPHEIVDEDRWSFNSVSTEKMEEEGEASQLLLASDNDDSVGSVFLTPDNIQELPNGFVGVNTVVYKLCISGDVQSNMEYVLQPDDGEMSC